MTSAILVLEDGRTFAGEAYGAAGETFGEAVFNTGMTGYQETLTDPSYHRQVVVQTAPHIGNTGVNDEDRESRRIWVAGYVVRDPARRASNWRARRTLDDELRRAGRRRDQRHRHPGADPPPARTRRDARRRLQRRPRTGVACSRRCCASPPMVGADLSAEVTTPQPYTVDAIGEHRFTVAALDFGIKSMTPHRMAAARDHVARAARRPPSADDVIATGADAVFLSNGPGDPATADAAVATVRELLRPPDADLRHLLRQPDPRPGVRVRHVQARLRPPRHQPAGAGPRHRQGRDHRAQPRLRGRRAAGRGQPRPTSARSRSATSASTTTSSKGLRALDAPRLHRAVPPGGRGRPARRRVPVRPIRRAARERRGGGHH